MAEWGLNVEDDRKKIIFYKKIKMKEIIMPNLFERMPDDRIKKYVPDVYQPDIYNIDYKKLKEKGIKLITFDLDDTIMPKHAHHVPVEVPPLIIELKKDFTVIILSNSLNVQKVQEAAKLLGVEGIPKAKKPAEHMFANVMEKYSIEVKQMAHVGNNIEKDVAGANSVGITSCLIRYVSKIKHNVIKGDKELKIELKKRGMWDKHHREEKGDQYYQIGEKQKPRTLHRGQKGRS